MISKNWSSAYAPACVTISFLLAVASASPAAAQPKPAIAVIDAGDAARILRGLSGQSHRVLTAVAVAFDGRVEAALSVSEVRFGILDEAEIERYVASGDPLDKAGAYGIQGRAAFFVEYLAGSYTGVMGLPLFETGALLKRFGYAL